MLLAVMFALALAILFWQVSHSPLNAGSSNQPLNEALFRGFTVKVHSTAIAGLSCRHHTCLTMKWLHPQGSVSVRGDPGTVGQTGKAFTPVGSTESWAVPATAASVTAPLREAGPNAAKRPLLIPKQLPDGAPRYCPCLHSA